MSIRKKLMSAAIMSLAATSASAQVESQTLDSVIIKENRIESSFLSQNKNLQILDRQQIMQLPVKSANELLAYIGGVDLRQRGPWGAQSDISIDGSTFDQVLVLVNGVKMSDPQTGHHLLNLPIPLSSIDHIEVLRGPAARIYGVNALAGAINIVTRVPQKDEVFAQVYAGSSFQEDTATGDTYYNWGAQASAALAGEKMTHTLSVAHDEGNGYRYNTAYKSNRIFYQNNISLGEKHAIDAMGGYINNDFGAALFYAAPNDINSTEKVETAIGSIRYTYQPNERISIRPRISYRYNKDDYIYVKQKPELYHNIHETNVVTGEVQSTIKMKSGVIGAGVELRNEQINSTNLGKRDRSNLGIYAEYKHIFSKKLNASAGVYVNNNSDYGWQVYPSVDAGYRFLPKWKIFANATTGQRLPTYTDLFYKGPTNIGNANLQTETAQYAEGGLQYNSDVFFAQGAYFYRHTEDFIDWVRPTLNDAWQPQNFQTLNTNGVAIQTIYRLSQHIGMNDKHSVVVRANYTYLHPEVVSPTNKISKYAIEALRHQFTASLQTVFFNHIQFNLNSRYLYRISAKDYTLLDMRIGYQWKKWNVYADINNLLDTQYREIAAVPMPGRWFTFGVRFYTGN